MDNIDEKTLYILDRKINRLTLLDNLLKYIQILNKDLVHMKNKLSEITGDDVNTLSSDDKKQLLESGNTINIFLKTIEQGKYLKEKKNGN